MIRSLGACLAALSLCACFKEPVSTATSNNPDVKVDTLFTHEGCTVYRFSDYGFHYYVKCQDTRSAQTMQTVSCGKGCTYEEEVPTATVSVQPVR